MSAYRCRPIQGSGATKGSGNAVCARSHENHSGPNAVFFTYALVRTSFYGIAETDVALYIFPFAAGNVSRWRRRSVRSAEAISQPSSIRSIARHLRQEPP